MSVWRNGSALDPYWALWNDLDPPFSRTVIVFDNDKQTEVDHWGVNHYAHSFVPDEYGGICEVANHNKLPMKSLCAECLTPLFQLDYLCDSCREST